VGLDYHQQSVQVCVMDRDGNRLVNRAVENDARAVAELIRRYGTPERIAIEACCGAANLAEELIVREQLPVRLAHPGYVARMKRSCDKTDSGDAGTLADLERVNYLPTVWLAPESTRELRRLVRHRAQQVARRKDVKLRIRALLRENRVKGPRDLNPWTKAWLAWLQQEAPLGANDRWLLADHLEELDALSRRIKASEARIQTVTADDPLVAQLLALAGVGLVTAVTMRAEIGRLDRFRTGKQLARFCGVTPRNASSGERQADAGLIKAGNPQLRCVLIELAQRLIHRIEGRWADLAHGMLQRGKPKNVVVAAVANRWVRWLFHELQRTPADLGSGSTKGAPAPSASTVASTSAAGAGRRDGEDGRGSPASAPGN
jgi:transposase